MTLPSKAFAEAGNVHSFTARLQVIHESVLTFFGSAFALGVGPRVSFILFVGGAFGGSIVAGAALVPVQAPSAPSGGPGA
eukprot:8431086-Pyramimonas_sp.AAC.1